METLLDLLVYSVEIMAILGITIEVIPIKFSPIKWLGNRFNSDIKKELEDVKKDIKQLKVEADYREIGTLRNRISSFDALCRLDVNHDQLEKHQYITAFKDIDKWDKYHETYKDLNGELRMAIENIQNHYKEAKFDNKDM